MTTHRATAVVKALAAAVLLIALLVGVPYVLLVAAGNPLPDPLPTLDDLTRPDPTGRLFLSAVALLGWAGWASFAVAVVAEIPAQIRRMPAPRLPGLAPQQRAAGVLLAVIAAGVVVPSASATTAAATTGPTSAPTAAVQVLTEQSPATAEQAPATAQDAVAGDDGRVGMATAAQPTPETPTVQVAPGDNLWDLAAEHLGTGERWREIATLNYDVVQTDGTSLGTDHTLRPGWTLTLPAPPAAAVDDQSTETRVVEPGDTLWDIAEQDLGDGQRYDEIAAATTSTVQPDGQQLTDPDLIQPGWQVTVPSADTPQEPTQAAAEQAAAQEAAAQEAAAQEAAAQEAAAQE
uniref:LysM peptidoglycan-binding domain-containing protein n=1 Tax=uncultured Pseudokineococcus sp. TaxID=1642928 RepID=UPI0026296950